MLISKRGNIFGMISGLPLSKAMKFIHKRKFKPYKECGGEWVFGKTGIQISVGTKVIPNKPLFPFNRY
jgi:hypothetical protein